MKKIKLLFVIDKLNIGGAQSHILQLLKGMNRDRFSLYLCCLMEEGDLFEETKNTGTSAFVLHVKRIYGPSGIRGMFKLARFIKMEGIDVVHTLLFSANILGNLSAKLAHAPLIISGRRDTGIHREGRWQHRIAYRFAHSLADRVFVVSNAVRDVVHRCEGVNLDKILTIYNGIELKNTDGNNGATELRKELGLGNSTGVVGIIAGLNWFKGYADFIAAASLILKEKPQTKFLIIGDGPLREFLQSLARQKGLDGSISFLGKRKDVRDLLGIMDVSVNASFSEGMSNTILESMAAGVPVVATNVDGNKEVVIDGETGFLVPLHEPEEMKRKIIYLLNNKQTAETMGQKARQLVQNKFSLSQMIKKLENAYIDLLKEKNYEYY